MSMAYENHWLPDFNFNIEEWFEGGHHETLAVCVTLELARVVFAAAVAKKPGSHFMIRNRTRVVQRHPEGDW
jgi:hypothetical protein